MKKVKVYGESINYRNEITDRCLIATFRNEIWADRFLEAQVTETYYNGRLCWRLVKEV